jgi:hypothetical protein
MLLSNGILAGATAAILIGIGATLVMDGWAAVQKRVFAVPSLDYGLVGRWIGHFPGGHFIHESIRKASPVRCEAVIGWAAHYAIGIVWAGILLGVWGLDWARQPTLLPALIVGIGTILGPFFIMQPAFGIGVAASNLPEPWTARFFSFVAHTSFAVGLYVSALLLAWVARL